MDTSPAPSAGPKARKWNFHGGSMRKKGLMEFHGGFSTFEQPPWRFHGGFHGFPWSSMEFQAAGAAGGWRLAAKWQPIWVFGNIGGTYWLSFMELPWNSMELPDHFMELPRNIFGFPQPPLEPPWRFFPWRHFSTCEP